MLKRSLFIIAILILAFTVTAVGQSNKRTLSKPKKVKQAKKGVSEWTDILARKNNKPTPKSNRSNSNRKTKVIHGKQPLGWNWGVDANGNPVQYKKAPRTKARKTKKP